MHSHSKNGRWNTYSVDQLIIKYVMGVRALGLSSFESWGGEVGKTRANREGQKWNIIIHP